MADEQTSTKYLSNDSWDYICTLLKTEFAKYTPTTGISDLFKIFKTVEVKQGENTIDLVPTSSTDKIQFIGGTNVTISANADAKTVTFNSKDTTYTLSVGTGEYANQLKFSDGTNDTYVTVPYAVSATTQDNSDNSTKIATTAFVHNLVATVTGLSLEGPYESLEALKTAKPTGEVGVIYLVSTSRTGSDACDEYYWNSKATPADYEFFGTTAVDLSEYIKKTDYMTETEIYAAWNNAQPKTS